MWGTFFVVVDDVNNPVEFKLDSGSDKYMYRKGEKEPWKVFDRSSLTDMEYHNMLSSVSSFLYTFNKLYNKYEK